MAPLNLQQTFDLALQHHQAGRLFEAEQLYRQILTQQPDNADAIHFLGMIAHSMAQNDTAIELIRRALALRPEFPRAYFNLGNVLSSEGKSNEAIAAYRQSIKLSPGFPDVHYNLGNALNSSGQFEEAIVAYRRAVTLRQNFPEGHFNLGNALSSSRQFDDAIVAYRQALAIRPSCFQVYNNLGNALVGRHRFDEAVTVYRQAIALQSDSFEGHNNLGNALREAGKLDEALTACRQAIALRPGAAEAYDNMGNILRSKGQLEDAVVAYRHAIALDPRHYQSHNNLGIVLNDLGLLDQAIVACRQAIALIPNHAHAYNNLAMALKEKGEIDAAVTAYRQSLALDPISPAVHNNLAMALKENGEIDAAIATCRQALALNPNLPSVHSNLIFTLYFHPSYDARLIAEELHRWNRHHAEPLRASIRPHTNDRRADRRLRIGYVSPDFRDHVVGQNILPLLEQHNRQQFEITCYAQVARPDAITGRLQQNADRWRNIIGLPDEIVAHQIRQDQVDILVDLSLHTSQNRLLVFARKPAPVQVTYLAYCGSSGMTTMDYRLSDPHFDPPGTDISVYSEKTMHLPQAYWCYHPAGPTDEPSPSPALKNGFITFGNLNNFAKVSPAALDLWADILRTVTNSRLIIHAYPGTHVEEATQRLENAGITKSRITFIGKQPWTKYTQTYSQIDIALDPFPYGGGITTCSALWMGVPVVTLSGDTAVGRGGRSILSNLGLTELIAFTPDQYKKIAIDLAQDSPRMQSLRQGMRARMLASPLMDAPKFARNIEAAYRDVWRKWCSSSSTVGSSR